MGGSDINVILEFPTLLSDQQPTFLHLNSLVTISYSVYRDKRPIFNLGQPTIDGFAIGNKYIAGSFITTMFLRDELSSFLDEGLKNAQATSNYRESTLLENEKDSSYKRIHTVMRDDLTTFNIHIVFSSEVGSEMSRIIIYDANFINNGQVMSIEDLVTENTLSFIAKDIREQHKISDPIQSIKHSKIVKKASSLVS